MRLEWLLGGEAGPCTPSSAPPTHAHATPGAIRTLPRRSELPTAPRRLADGPLAAALQRPRTPSTASTSRGSSSWRSVPSGRRSAPDRSAPCGGTSAAPRACPLAACHPATSGASSSRGRYLREHGPQWARLQGDRRTSRRAAPGGRGHVGGRARQQPGVRGSSCCPSRGWAPAWAADRAAGAAALNRLASPLQFCAWCFEAGFRRFTAAPCGSPSSLFV